MSPLCPLTPSQEQWDRLLVLYPTSLAIFSEEADGLSFKVGLPHCGPAPGRHPMCGGGRGHWVRRNLYFGACWNRGMLATPIRPASLVSLVSALTWGRRGPCLVPCVIPEGPQPPARPSRGQVAGARPLLGGSRVLALSALRGACLSKRACCLAAPWNRGPILPAACSSQGELPLRAVHINLEEREKQIRSFLIEGGLWRGWEGGTSLEGASSSVGPPQGALPTWPLTASVCRAPHQHHPRAVCQLRGLQPLAALPAGHLPQGGGPRCTRPGELPGAADAHTGEGQCRGPPHSSGSRQCSHRRTEGWVWARVGVERVLPSCSPTSALPRSWAAAEALSPQMDRPAGTLGARCPPPPAPATPSPSPQCRPPQAALPSLHP